jgi:outer membrane protein
MNPTNKKHRWMLASAGAALLLTCLNATAQGRAAHDDDDDGDGDGRGGSGLQLIAGAAVLSGPKYPGSSVRQTEVIPLLGARYGRYFVGGAPDTGVPFGLGANLLQGSPWRLGVVLGPDFKKPRKASDDPRLVGLGDVAATTHLGLFGGYSQPGWSLRGNVLSDAGGKHQGTTASLELEGKFTLTDRLVLSAGPGLRWADKRYTQTFFGVDATQAAQSGRARYDTNAGLNTLKFSVGLEYRIDPRWFVSARAAVESLRGDARSSPVTAENSPYTLGVFTGYRF